MMASQPDPSQLEFVLSRADGRPMYLQIMEQIQERVAVGDWPPGARLPSIRELATAARVSVITVKRAYLELERSGAIVTHQGKGSWVSDRDDGGRLQRDELARLLSRAAALAASLGLSRAELHELLARHVRD